MNTFDNKHIQIADFLAEKGYLPISKKGTNWAHGEFSVDCPRTTNQIS